MPSPIFLHRQDIQIRDPYIVPVAEEKAYYLFGTTDINAWSDSPDPTQHGFDCYRSADLENWTGPFPAFRPPAGFWATHQFWAPEVHRFNGRWFMLASFKAEGVCRGTQIFTADQICGPYRPHSDGPVTPRGWECLDGTLFIDDAGDPWTVFCHEWLQIHHGTIDAIRLSRDMTRPISPPMTLLCARDAQWIYDRDTRKDIVTDGPFLYRTAGGELLLLWSSFLPTGYAIAAARSASGRIEGPWQHDPHPIFDRDGGHGMLFHTFDGRLMLSIHSPNNTPMERPIFVELKEEQGTLAKA